MHAAGAGERWELRRAMAPTSFSRWPAPRRFHTNK
ncbi:hypothetical protein BPC006_I3329 [Burkholderia pseudomallei BPC006]|nr:hypothetical protein BPC006_I3329 [Burkholderia pseudomallei BPC006]